MIELFIDTVSSRIIVAILKDGKIKSIHNEKNGHDLSTRILPIIDNVFNEAKVIPNEVDTIYVVNGPGSFTGIRIGVTIAKTYAWSMKKRIITLSELALMATTSVDTDLIIPLIDARRNASYAGIYDKNGNSVLSDCYISNDDLKEKLSKDKTFTFISYDNIDAFDTVEPNIDLELFINMHRNDVAKNPHEVNPEYLKLTEAEENLKKDKYDN